METPTMVEFWKTVEAKRQFFAFACHCDFKGLAVCFDPFDGDAGCGVGVPGWIFGHVRPIAADAFNHPVKSVSVPT